MGLFEHNILFYKKISTTPFNNWDNKIIGETNAKLNMRMMGGEMGCAVFFLAETRAIMLGDESDLPVKFGRKNDV